MPGLILVVLICPSDVRAEGTNLRLHAAFDGTLTARTPAGSLDPLLTEKDEFAPGRVGQALDDQGSVCLNFGPLQILTLRCETS